MIVDPWRLQRTCEGLVVGRATKRCDVVEVEAGVGFVMGCQCWSLHDTAVACGETQTMQLILKLQAAAQPYTVSTSLLASCFVFSM
jgi:hypothetical protein